MDSRNGMKTTGRCRFQMVALDYLMSGPIPLLIVEGAGNDETVRGATHPRSTRDLAAQRTGSEVRNSPGQYPEGRTQTGGLSGNQPCRQGPGARGRHGRSDGVG